MVSVVDKTCICKNKVVPLYPKLDVEIYKNLIR